ncbi:MAG: phosphoribosylglycinamide formyltransferase [Planctomycetes bacterium RBG_16_43_13]|nr:MAG: phosphoribosylglycinamide formyltransferase [Planctomycetes bacterium RBG_16_43_13]
MKPINLAVLISGAGRTLQNLIDCIERGELAAKIPLVISSVEDAKGIDIAKRQGIPTKIVSKKQFSAVENFSNAITRHLDTAKPDLVLMAGFIHLYKIPDRYLGHIINIHPALLPQFGGKGFYGRKVHEQVLKDGAKESGCTVHFADNVYDHGKIILQRRIPILSNDTPDTLAERVFREECIAYPEAIRMISGEMAHRS